MKKRIIPSIDISEKGFGSFFLSSLKEYGCVELEGKSIKKIKALTSLIKKDYINFSKLSEKKKIKYFIPEVDGDYGFVPIKKHETGFITFFESYIVWKRLPEDHPLKKKSFLGFEFRKNKKIKEFPKLISSCEKLLELIEKTDLEVLEELSKELDVEKGYLSKKFCYGTYLLRMLYYPEISKKTLKTGFSQHIDMSFFTWYLDVDEGLQLIIKGKKMSYTDKKDRILYGVSQGFEYLTGNNVKGLPHSVGLNNKSDRFSIVCLSNVRPFVDMEVVKKYQKKSNLKNFPEIPFAKWIIMIYCKEGIFTKKIRDQYLKNFEKNKISESEMEKKIVSWEKKKEINKISKYIT